MRICSTCKDEKPFDEFTFRNRSKGLYKHQCKTCDQQTRRRTYEKHKDKVIAHVRATSKAKREWYQEFKSTLRCCVCGESDPACLDFHHVDSVDKDFDLGLRAHQVSRQTLLAEISKCACLCANCHRKEHAGRLNASLVKVDITRASEA